MGKDLQKLTKFGSGLDVAARGNQVNFDGPGKRTRGRLRGGNSVVAKLDGDLASFRCPQCGRKTTWSGYAADAFRAPIELCCSHCDAETFFDHVDVPGRQVSVSNEAR